MYIQIKNLINFIKGDIIGAEFQWIMRCVPFLFIENKNFLFPSINLTHKNPLHLKYCINYLKLYHKKETKSENSEKILWIRNDASDIYNFIAQNFSLVYSPEILNKVIDTGGDTDTTLALIGALNDEEFLPQVKFNCPKIFLEKIEKYESRKCLFGC